MDGRRNDVILDRNYSVAVMIHLQFGPLVSSVLHPSPIAEFAVGLSAFEMISGAERLATSF